MIIRQKELKKVQQEDFLGGKGIVNFEHFLNEDMAKGAGRLFAKTTLAPGASIGKHTHKGDFEVYYILKGKALLDDNGAEVEMGPGDVNFCADGQSHGIKNIGEDDLVYIAIVLYTEQKK